MLGEILLSLKQKKLEHGIQSAQKSLKHSQMTGMLSNLNKKKKEVLGVLQNRLKIKHRKKPMPGTTYKQKSLQVVYGVKHNLNKKNLKLVMNGTLLQRKMIKRHGEPQRNQPLPKNNHKIFGMHLWKQTNHSKRGVHLLPEINLKQLHSHQIIPSVIRNPFTINQQPLISSNQQ